MGKLSRRDTLVKRENKILYRYDTLFSREENFAKSEFEIFSREDIFANTVHAKISSRENILSRKYPPAKFFRAANRRLCRLGFVQQ